MTLVDFVRLLGRYWKLCVVLSLVFAVGAGVFAILGGQSASYTAHAYVMAGTSAQLSTLNGTASSAAREYVAANSDYNASAKADTASLTVTITAIGPSSSGAADAANEVADSAVEGAKKLLPEGISASIQSASAGEKSNGRGLLTYILVALLVGLFVAVCIVVGIDAVKRPVKGAADLADASGLPVLGELPGDPGARLLANARFASSKEELRDLLVVPVREGDPAALVGMLIDYAARTESPAERDAHGGPVRVNACAPLLMGVAAAYEARAADAVLIACAQWDDSRKDVESTASELRLAGANAVGCVLVKKEASRHSKRKKIR